MKKTISELQAELENLEETVFILKMKDRWTDADYKYLNEQNAKIESIKKQIREAEND